MPRIVTVPIEYRGDGYLRPPASRAQSTVHESLVLSRWLDPVDKGLRVLLAAQALLNNSLGY